MKITPFLMAVCLAFGVSAKAGVLDVFSGTTSYPDALYMKASLYEQEGNYEEASKLLEAVLETTDDEYVFLKLANAYSKVGDMEMMKYTLERAVRKSPTSAMLIGALADTYRMEKETIDKAIPLYKKAYELSKNIDYIRAQAKAFEAKGDFNNAIIIYNSLVAIDQKSDDYVHRGMSYDKLGLKDSAIADYQAAVEIDANVVAAAKLAGYYLDKKDTDNAIKYLQLIITDNPELSIAKFKIALLLLQMGRDAEAEEYFLSIAPNLNDTERLYVYKQLGKKAFSKKELEKAKKYFTLAYDIDKDVQTAYTLALIAEGDRDNERAKAWYEHILKSKPDFAEAAKKLAILHLTEKNPVKAIAAVANIEDVFKDITYYRIIALAYSDMKDYKKAEAVLRDALNKNPAEVQLYIDLALSVDRQGDKTESENIIKKGLENFPDEAPLLNFLGYLYAEQGIKLDEAEKLIKKALSVNPQEAAYIDSLAWIHYQRGEYGKAFDLQKKALKNAPNEPEIVDHMKAIMKKLGINKKIDEILKEK